MSKQDKRKSKIGLTSGKQTQIQASNNEKAVVIEEYHPSSDLELTLKVLSFFFQIIFYFFFLFFSTKKKKVGDIVSILSKENNKMWKGEVCILVSISFAFIFNRSFCCCIF
jgi:hypothetical protein